MARTSSKSPYEKAKAEYETALAKFMKLDVKYQKVQAAVDAVKPARDQAKATADWLGNHPALKDGPPPQNSDDAQEVDSDAPAEHPIPAPDAKSDSDFPADDGSRPKSPAGNPFDF